MAKKKTTKRKYTRRNRSDRNLEDLPAMGEESFSSGARARAIGDAGAYADRDYKEILREFVSSPAVKYVAGGIATALLTRLANNMADKYPEISHFIRENMDNLEGKLGEFRDTLQGSARH
jgi:hypothetical protein